MDRPSRLYVSKRVKPAVQGEIDALFVGGMGEDRASTGAVETGLTDNP
jgi:hypothetical protein